MNYDLYELWWYMMIYLGEADKLSFLRSSQPFRKLIINWQKWPGLIAIFPPTSWRGSFPKIRRNPQNGHCAVPSQAWLALCEWLVCICRVMFLFYHTLILPRCYLMSLVVATFALTLTFCDEFNHEFKVERVVLWWLCVPPSRQERSRWRERISHDIFW